MAVDASTTPWTVGVGTMRESARELLDAARGCLDTDPTEALRLAQHARVMARNDNDPAMEAEAYYRVASIVYQNADTADAFGIALAARDLAAKCGATIVEVFASNLLALIHYDTSNYSEALRCGLAALDLYRLHRDSLDDEHEGGLLNTIAMVHHSLGDLDRALSFYDAAIVITRSGTRPALQAATLLNMAEIRMERGELWTASGEIDQALELARVHAPDMVPGLLCRLVDCWIGMGIDRPAGSHLAEARALLEAAGRGSVEPSETAWTLWTTEGHLAAQQGQDEAAIACFASALEVATRIGKLDAALKSHGDLAATYRRIGRFEKALDHQEARFLLRDQLFGTQADLRIRTLQTAHDTAAARQQAEILRLRTGDLETLVRSRTSNLEDSQLAAFRRLAELAESRAADREGHLAIVGDLASELADALDEPVAWAHALAQAAPLHDIGLIGLPDRVLHHDADAMTENDRQLLMTHTRLGAELLEGSASGVVQLAAQVALGHHEHWDGTGYPNGASMFDIPLGARIVAVADAFDAARRGSPTQAPCDVVGAARLVHAGAGTRFEPRIVDALLAVLTRRHPDQTRALASLAW